MSETPERIARLIVTSRKLREHATLETLSPRAPDVRVGSIGVEGGVVTEWMAAVDALTVGPLHPETGVEREKLAAKLDGHRAYLGELYAPTAERQSLAVVIADLDSAAAVLRSVREETTERRKRTRRGEDRGRDARSYDGPNWPQADSRHTRDRRAPSSPSEGQ